MKERRLRDVKNEHESTIGAASRKSKIFVVDDHPIVRQGLGLLINREPDMIVCGAAEEAQSALRAIPALQPDVLIVDISLSGPDGLELVKTIRTQDREFADPGSLHA